MNSIQNEIVALDTNEFIFALRHEAARPACETLLFDHLSKLQIFIPLQVLIELQRNLTDVEMRGVLRALMKAKAVTWDHAPPAFERVRQWEERGAKKGDAIIAAHLEAVGVRYFISENRHFLAELSDLPFQVLSSEEAVRLLA